MQRERLTITLEPDLIAAADSLIDKSAIRNRSHALEHLIKEGLGLHLLRQAFFFVAADWEQRRLEELLALCVAQGIETVFLCVSAEAARIRSDIRALISDRAPGMAVRDVPLDFGSGGAILLQKEALAHPFLLAWLSGSLTLPPSLVGAYASYRAQQSVVTQLICSPNGQEYRRAGLAIAGPSLLAQVPAGIVSLEESVFPELLKAGKVGTYAFPA
jgi:NDP-sugar pyrophosphorylase family protein